MPPLFLAATFFAAFFAPFFFFAASASAIHESSSSSARGEHDETRGEKTNDSGDPQGAGDFEENRSRGGAEPTLSKKRGLTENGRLRQKRGLVNF